MEESGSLGTVLEDSTTDDHSEQKEMFLESPVLRRRPGAIMGLPATKRTLEEILKSHGRADGENREQTLDPNHPLMKRFQQGLKEHLLKLHEESDVQIRELNKAIQDQSRGKEDLGVRLYGLQKELFQQKDILTKIHDKHRKTADIKTEVQKEFDEAKSSHKMFDENLANEKKKEQHLQKEMEDFALQVVQLTALQTEASADSTVMKRAAEKATKDRESLELEKLRQDLLISRLEEDRHRLEEKINLYKAQCAIKKEEASDLRKELTESKADLQAVHYERLKIMQQWRYSITSLQKKDETCSALRESVRLNEEDMQTLKMEILSHKKSVRNELERNEKLTHLLLYREAEVARLEKSINENRSRQQAMEQEYALYDRTVNETENALQSLNCEQESKRKELKEKSKQVEKAYTTQRELDDKYMEIMHEKFTLNKAAQYTRRLIKNLQKQMKKKAETITSKESEITKLNLEIINRKNHIDAMENKLSQLNEEITAKDNTITKAEEEISRSHAILEKKQVTITDLNKKLDAFISSAGGMELGPLEREISGIKKEIELSEESRRNMEQEWLRFQTELVSLTNDATAQRNEIDLYNRRLAILEEKKMRLEVDVSKEEKEVRDVENNLRNLQNDVVRINTLLYHETDQQKRLQQDTQMLKTEFIKALKEAELDCLEKEAEVANLKKEKEKLIYLLVEAQREVLLWEGKLQVADEARKTIKSESQNEKILELKSEIRRLQVRLQQIKKEQEELIQRMEKAVYNHATLYTKVELQLQCGIKKESAQFLLKKMERMKRKIQQDKKEVARCDAQTKSEEIVYSELMSRIRELEKIPFLLMSEMKSLEKDSKVKQKEKLKNIITLSLKQRKTKCLQNMKDGKYIPAVKNEAKRAAEIERILQHIEAIGNITETVSAANPQLHKEISRTMDYISLVDTL